MLCGRPPSVRSHWRHRVAGHRLFTPNCPDPHMPLDAPNPFISFNPFHPSRGRAAAAGEGRPRGRRRPLRQERPVTRDRARKQVRTCTARARTCVWCLCRGARVCSVAAVAACVRGRMWTRDTPPAAGQPAACVAALGVAVGGSCRFRPCSSRWGVQAHTLLPHCTTHRTAMPQPTISYRRSSHLPQPSNRPPSSHWTPLHPTHPPKLKCNTLACTTIPRHAPQRRCAPAAGARGAQHARPRVAAVRPRGGA
jgi:hypothetical protein